jgi:nucleoside-diphosphate-sugar epimerase
MTRVLVTGATGFCGRPLVARLVAAGYDVRVAVRRVPVPPLPAGVETALHGDLADTVDWAPLLAGVDAVVHLAGIAHVTRGIPEDRYDRVNHRATAELANAAQRAGVRHLLLVSSIRAQCGPAADHVLTEADTPRPSDAYGRSKLAAEAAVAASGVPFTILRPVLIYGPGLKGNLAMLARLAALPVPLPFAGFVNRRSLLSLDNLIGAILFVLATPATQGETYVVADPQPITFAEIVAALRPGPPRLFALPHRLVATAARMIVGADAWDRLNGELIAFPGKLIAAGWSPTADTKAALRSAAQAPPRSA